jgi:hypothetical protein
MKGSSAKPAEPAPGDLFVPKGRGMGYTVNFRNPWVVGNHRPVLAVDPGDDSRTALTPSPARLMTVHIDWPSDVVERLTEEARQKGLPLDVYLL